MAAAGGLDADAPAHPPHHGDTGAPASPVPETPLRGPGGKPEIFGTLFHHSMDAEECHAFGAHFTSEFDIQKVVGPTIVRPWRERIEAARSDKAVLVGAGGVAWTQACK